MDIRDLTKTNKVFSVKCHHGSFIFTEEEEKKHQDTVHSLVDLCEFTRTEGEMLPNDSEEWAKEGGEGEKIFSKLEWIFFQIYHSSPDESIIWFWCDSGQRNSPALATAFLMWATRCNTNAIPQLVLMRMQMDSFAVQAPEGLVAWGVFLSNYARYRARKNPKSDPYNWWLRLANMRGGRPRKAA